MKQHFKRNAFFYIIIIGLIGFAGYQYVDHGLKMSKVRDNWEDKRQELSFYTKQAMDSSNLNTLALATKTLVWAVRTEWLSQNYAEVNRYILELEKDQHIGQVLICDTAAIVQQASDAQLIGQPFPKRYGKDLLQKSTISLEMGEKGMWYLTAPIMGLNNRVGTLFFTYQHKAAKINSVIQSLKIEEETPGID